MDILRDSGVPATCILSQEETVACSSFVDKLRNARKRKAVSERSHVMRVERGERGGEDAEEYKHSESSDDEAVRDVPPFTILHSCFFSQ